MGVCAWKREAESFWRTRRRVGLKRIEESSTELLSGENILAEYILAQYDLSGVIRIEIMRPPFFWGPE